MAQTYALTVSGDDHKTTHDTQMNNRAEALRSAFSGSLAPSSPTPVAGQLWYDTTNLVVKKYNGTIWIPLTKSRAFSFTSGSLAQNTFDSVKTFAHGFGNDNVYVSAICAKGSSVGNEQDWGFMWTRADGKCGKMKGGDDGNSSFEATNAPSAPSAGNLSCKVGNVSSTSQTFAVIVIVSQHEPATAV